ncbi:MAG: helix-hairpin-helix domain-containing protein [Planctomycetaceae bacterium]|nr:MAG: helix-hairpin-helix domain-containing protein [Planctomycetaceae bacterium]
MRNIDLNTASKEDLLEVSGIDPSLADRIIQFRDERGGIDSVDELREVGGISESTIEELRAAAGESESADVESEGIEESEEEEEW